MRRRDITSRSSVLQSSNLCVHLLQSGREVLLLDKHFELEEIKLEPDLRITE